MQADLVTIRRLFKQVCPESIFTYRFFDASIAMLYEKDCKTAALINVAWHQHFYFLYWPVWPGIVYG